MEKIIVDIEVKSDKGVKDVEKLNKEVAKTGKEVTKTKEKTKEANKETTALGSGAMASFNKFKGAVLGVVKGFKSLKFAIIATGLGALLIGILAIKTAFTNSEEGQNKFAKLMGVIGSITGNLIDVLADLGMGIIAVFENPKKAILDFKDLLISQVTNRIDSVIETVGFLGSAMKKVFSGDFGGAIEDAKKAGSSYIDTLTGVKNTIDKVSGSVKGMASEMTKEAKIASNISDQRAKADKIERDLVVGRAKADRDIAELRFKSEQRDKFTAKERVAFLQKASAISEDISLKEISANKLRLDAQIAENKLSGSTKEDLNAVAVLKAKSIQLDTAKLNLQKRLQTSLTTFQNEEKSGFKKIADAKQKAIDANKKLDNKTKEDKIKREQKALDDVNALIEADKIKKEDAESVSLEEKAILDGERAVAKLEALQIGLDAEGEAHKALAILISDTEILYSNKTAEAKAKDAAKALKLKKDQANTEANTEKKLADTKLAVMNQSANAVIEIVGRESAVGKAVAVAQAIWNTKNAITKTLASVPAPFNIPSAIAVGAFGLAQVKGILSTPNPSGGGGVSTPSSPSTPAAAPSLPPSFNVVGASETNQLATSIGSQSQEPTRAYVVSGDVTSAQSMDRNIIDGASI